MAGSFTPQAPYSELRRVETFINQAHTVEDMRRIAATEGSAIGYRALGRLIAGTMTAAEMKPDEARAAQAVQATQPAAANAEDALAAAIEVYLTLANFYPAGKQPYPYQIDGIRFLARSKGALLGDEMGLGKTIQAIGALKVLHSLKRVQRALILCPRTLISQWEHELREWAPELFVQKVRGSQEARAQYWRSGATVHITNYETWRNDSSKMRDLRRQFDLVIFDEAQTFKQPESATTTAVQKIAAAYRWGLSGTPLENRLEDIVTIYSVLLPDLLRKLNQPYQAQSVKRLIQPYFLRRRISATGLSLPEKIRKDVWLELTNRQRQTYERIEAESRRRLLEPGMTGTHVWAEISKLKQTCSYDSETHSSCKLDYLVQELEIIVANHQKALVFSQYPQITLRPLMKRLQSFDPAIYDGTLSDMQARQLVNAFQGKEAPRVLLTSVRAGGTGLNLTRASQVFHFDQWWNPAVARQAEARAHRIGQSDRVVVFSLYAKDTIDERIYDLLRSKERLFGDVIDDLTEEEIKGSLTLQELFGLFGLDAPKPNKRQPAKKRAGYYPTASYKDLKRAETRLKQAQTAMDVRRIAREECSIIGNKAFCFLLGELSTPELMRRQ